MPARKPSADDFEFLHDSIANRKCADGIRRVRQQRNDEICLIGIAGLFDVRSETECFRWRDGNGTGPDASILSRAGAETSRNNSCGAISYAVALERAFVAGKISVITPSRPASKPQHSISRLTARVREHFVQNFRAHPDGIGHARRVYLKPHGRIRLGVICGETRPEIRRSHSGCRYSTAQPRWRLPLDPAVTKPPIC